MLISHTRRGCYVLTGSTSRSLLPGVNLVSTGYERAKPRETILLSLLTGSNFRGSADFAG